MIKCPKPIYSPQSEKRGQLGKMEMASELFLFPRPNSLFISVMTVVHVVSLAVTGVLEVGGKHLQYSKFWNLNPDQKPLVMKKKVKVSGRAGFVILYAPALFVGLASFWVFPDQGLRFLLLRSAITIHFFKRVFESLFIHKYSSNMVLEDAITISFSYFMSALTSVYAQHLTQGLKEPGVDLKYLGIVAFLVGIIGNFYHHYILSTLRKKDGDREYMIPKGGLFGLVICPHYLFEIVGLVGVSLVSQTMYSWSFTIGSTFYLMGRSYATRRWYLSKFENFPQNVKALVPFLF